MGGNAVKDITRIDQENVEATMDDIYKRLLPKLGLTKADTRLLGSTGKKKPGGSSGDIDLAIDLTKLAEKFGTTDVKKIMSEVAKVAGKLSPSVNNMSGLGIVSLAYPIANTNGEQPDSFVQLDLMGADNLEWAEWIYYSPSEYESEKKGLYRNSLLSSISHDAGRTGDDVEWNRKLLHFGTGLHDVTFSKQGKKGLLKKGKEISRKFLSKDPQQVIDVLLGPKFKAGDIKSFEDIWAAVTSKDFIHKKYLKQIVQRSAEDIEKKGYPIPEEYKKYL